MTERSLPIGQSQGAATGPTPAQPARMGMGTGVHLEEREPRKRVGWPLSIVGWNVIVQSR